MSETLVELWGQVGVVLDLEDVLEDVGGGCRRALDMVGGLLDLEAALEDVLKSRKDRHLEFAVLSAEFFFALSPPG